MTTPLDKAARNTIEQTYREHSRYVFATLVRLISDFDLAEEALHEAFTAALEIWPREGIPENPRAWLISTGRFKAIDTIRRRTRFDDSLKHLVQKLETRQDHSRESEDERVEDDQLRLIFTCCHPALAPESQVALTLREVCGLSTEEIARAFLQTAPTIAQRIVRGKAKIRDAGISYEIPRAADLPDRVDSVLAVVYLVFNEGYSASSGNSILRTDLSTEAIRLGRIIVELLPEPETLGLLALMLFQESRRKSRATPSGELVLLEDQDRTLWDREKISEANRFVEQSFASGPVGLYSLQAAIASIHANASTPQHTNWNQIVGLYDLMEQIGQSPVISLNRAVAVAMRDGPVAGLELIENLLQFENLKGYHLAHSARADLCRRLGKTQDARESYENALALTKLEPERRFLEQRLRELAQT